MAGTTVEMIEPGQTLSSDDMSNEENTNKGNVHFDENILNRQKSINNRELLVAASKGDPDKVRDLIKEGADVNFIDKDGNTALHYAVGSRNLKVVQLLLNKTEDKKNQIEDVNVKNNENKSALNIAREININMQDIIEEIEDKILDTSLNMLKNKGESSSVNVNTSTKGSSNSKDPKDDAAKKIKEKINFCLNALNELTKDPNQIKKFTHKNVNIFILFLEALALQDVEVNNNLSEYTKEEYIKIIFKKEDDKKIITDIRNFYMHRKNKTNQFINDLILGPEYLQNFVMTKNKKVNVKKFFEDLHYYVHGVYKKLENQQNKRSKQDDTNQKGLDQILKCDSPFNIRKKEKQNKTLLDIFGDLIKEVYKSPSEQQAEQSEDVMFNFIVNIIPLIDKDLNDNDTDILTELKKSRDNLVHNFHRYESLEFRMIELRKVISSSKSNLFKYYFSRQVHNILVKIPCNENYSKVEEKISEELIKSIKLLKERSFDLAEEEVNSLEYKFVNLLFKSKDDVKNKKVIEELVDQYFKFMIIIDHEEIEGEEQMNNEDEANTFLNQCKKLSNVERREVFEDFINLKEIQELSDEESEKIKELKKKELKDKLAGYFKIRDNNFDKIVKSYIEEKNSLDEETEEQAKKVANIIHILINIQHISHFSIQDVISLYKTRVFDSSDCEDIFKKNEFNETSKSRIKSKLNALPDSDEIRDVEIASKRLQISITKIVINVINIFFNTYNKYKIEFNVKELFNDDMFLNCLISRDITKDRQSNPKLRYQFTCKKYIFIIIKKLINIEYMAPYIACLLAKVQNTEAIEKDDLIKLLTILIKRESYIPYLNELLCIKTENGFCFYREVCNILRNNKKENFYINNMDAVFKKPEHVQGILSELLKESIEDVTVELMQKVLKLVNNVILYLFYHHKCKTSEEIINLKEIELMQKVLKEKYPKQDIDSIVEYKLNKAKVKNFQELYNEALEALEGVRNTKGPQSLLVLCHIGYTKSLLKKHDEAYTEYEKLYRELVKLTLNVDYSSTRGKDIYTKEICIKIASTERYQMLLDSSSEYMKYLDITNIGSSMAYSKICSKNYDEAFEIYKVIYDVVTHFKNRNKSTSWIVKKIAKVNCDIANSKTDSGDDQSALQYYYDSLIEYNTVLEMEKKQYGFYHPIIILTYKRIHNILNSIPKTHIKIGKLQQLSHTEETLKHYERALNIIRRIYKSLKTDKGEDDLSLKALDGIAYTCNELGKLHWVNNREEAVKYYEEALNVNKRIFESSKNDKGEEDECTLKALNHITYLCYTISCYEESQNNLEKALEYCNDLIHYDTILLNNYKKLSNENKSTSEQVKKREIYLEKSKSMKESLLKKLQMTRSWR